MVTRFLKHQRDDNYYAKKIILFTFYHCIFITSNN